MVDLDNAIEFSVRSPSYVRDPYEVYRLLRDHDPVHFSRDGYWFLTKYEDVSAGLKDLRLRNSPAPFSLLNRKNCGKYIAADVANRWIAFADPPEHSIRRHIIAGSFQSILQKKTQEINSVAHSCVAAIQSQQDIDFVKDFSLPYSARCIAEFFGFAPEVADRLPYWADMTFYLFHSFPNRDVFLQVNAAISEFRGFMSSRLEESKKTLRDDFFAQMMITPYRGTRLSDDQIIDNAMLVCSDAIGNVHSGLTTAVLTLLSHEDQLDQIRKDPNLISAAIDECLRFESPAQYQGRIAGEEIELRGRKIRKNSIVLLAIGSANRDPNFAQDPDRFDIRRRKTPHVSFGLGAHRCIGIAFVKMAFENALSNLLLGDIKLKLVEQEKKWIARAGHRWLQSLRVKIN